MQRDRARGRTATKLAAAVDAAGVAAHLAAINGGATEEAANAAADAARGEWVPVCGGACASQCKHQRAACKRKTLPPQNP